MGAQQQEFALRTTATHRTRRRLTPKNEEVDKGIGIENKVVSRHKCFLEYLWAEAEDRPDFDAEKTWLKITATDLQQGKKTSYGWSLLWFGGAGVCIWQGIANNSVFFGFAAMFFVFGIYSCVKH